MKRISIGSSIGFCGILGIVFITLKLCHVIEWAWIWALAPLWGPFALWLLSFIIYIVVASIIDGIKSSRNKRLVAKPRKNNTKASKKDDDLKKQVKAWEIILKYGYQPIILQEDEAFTKDCTHLMIKFKIPNWKIYEKRKLEKAINTLFGGKKCTK